MVTQVASIYFAPVKAERMYGGPYELPAVPHGSSPARLEVNDRVQIEQGPYQLGQGGRRSRRQHLVLGQTIARDIVAEWTANGVGMTPQCHPGIWVVREMIPQTKSDGTPEVDADGIALWRAAEPHERKLMWDQDYETAKIADRAYASMLFLQASAMAEEPKLIPLIPQTARLAAKHYGLDAEWLREHAALNVRECPYCTKVIPAKAIKCPRCAEIVDVEAYALLEIQKQSTLKLAKETARAIAQ